MKKILIGAVVAVILLLVLVALLAHFYLDTAVKKGVETVGPALVKVDVKLDSASISLMSGSGKLTGFKVGNPEGYKSPNSISLGSAALELKPSSVFADKVIIKSINIQAPEVTFETDLKGNNLKKILDN